MIGGTALLGAELSQVCVPLRFPQCLVKSQFLRESNLSELMPTLRFKIWEISDFNRSPFHPAPCFAVASTQIGRHRVGREDAYRVLAAERFRRPALAAARHTLHPKHRGVPPPLVARGNVEGIAHLSSVQWRSTEGQTSSYQGGPNPSSNNFQSMVGREYKASAKRRKICIDCM
jgi:hypothetical protein